jgi:hypothetical protein
VIENEQEVADVFNDIFEDKIKLLKENKDQSYEEDPLPSLKEKLKSRGLYLYSSKYQRRKS